MSAERVRLQLKGVLLMAVLLGLVGLSIAMYEKTFVSAVHVSVVAQRAGLQLNKNGDVRLKGALIGRITSVRQVGDHAVIGLALDPAAARDVPRDAEVRILPTTLFGQKYVELVRPAGSTAPAVADGAVLHEDTGATAIEVGTVLDRLEPVLVAVRPQDLSTTLDAIATGLQGRGAQLGSLISSAHAFLHTFNRQLPLLARDIRLLASVSDVYAAIAPDLLRILANTTVTARTLTADKVVLAAFLTNVQRASGIGATFLASNAPTTAALLHDSAPVLAMLARFSPEFGCLLAGLIDDEKISSGPFQHGIFQVRMVLGAQAKGYGPQDVPVLGDAGRGPSCAGLPRPSFPVPAFLSAMDGVGP